MKRSRRTTTQARGGIIFCRGPESVGHHSLHLKQSCHRLSAPASGQYAHAVSPSRLQARPLKLKKNFNVFLILSENILDEKKDPATRLLISPIVG
jgi:ABC-type phosphonate transport system ATPase subunit